MSPFASIASQIAFDASWWRSSVVRMKSSFEQFIRSTMARKRGTLRSSNSRGGQALARGGLLDLLAVLVGAGEEKDVVAVEPHEARDRVGRDRLIGVADMRHAVRIGDRGGDVIARTRPARASAAWASVAGPGLRRCRLRRCLRLCGVRPSTLTCLLPALLWPDRFGRFLRRLFRAFFLRLLRLFGGLRLSCLAKPF